MRPQPLSHSRGIITRREDYRHGGLQYPDFRESRFASHDRHGEIQQDSADFGPALPHDVHRDFSVLGDEHAVSMRLQNGPRHGAHSLFVIHHEHGAAALKSARLGLQLL